MEIKLEQKVYSSGTVETSCKIYMIDDYKTEWLVYDLAVLVFKCCYKFERSSAPLNSNLNTTIYVDSDLVEKPKTLTQYDWQLLKILHSEVQHFQWEIFQILKDLVDNRVEEEYSLERIKSILQKENKIES
ncbi:hypothetical protein phiA019_0050 [Aeromonas phage phiA019]|nr:hypothetical protein phiA009_0054 [Aeromonas phage phiA009]ULG01587.1 hypothetical protein phiA019_0050 [Aeromonas phage phiA019]